MRMYCDGGLKGDVEREDVLIGCIHVTVIERKRGVLIGRGTEA